MTLRRERYETFHSFAFDKWATPWERLLRPTATDGKDSVCTLPVENFQRTAGLIQFQLPGRSILR
jgi:hypothetical protein